jgi:hypothetical protein
MQLTAALHAHRAVWDACGMPWVPELFSAPALQEVLDRRRREKLLAVPYFDGLNAGEPEALVESFAGEPELYDPVRGRVRGARALEGFVAEMRAWLAEHNASVEDVQHVILDARGFEEVVLHVDGPGGRLDLPFAIVADRGADGRIAELRLYYGNRSLTGRYANRPPLLQPDPELRESDVVAEYQRALAAGDVDAIVATFETDGSGLRAEFGRLFSEGGGIPLEKCAIADDGRSCALEYNLVRWGDTQLPPQAGMAVFVRAESGRIAAVRVYGDVDPPTLRSQPWKGA